MIAGVSIEIPLDRNYLRTNLGGGICPACRWAADHGHPHPCITHPNADRTVRHLNHTGVRLPPELFIQLAAHPAQPFGNDPAAPHPRPTDRSWCSCQCVPFDPIAQPSGARA